MKRKSFFLLLIVLLGGLIWYLFIKPSDYTVRFEVKTFAGAINQTIKTWHRSLENKGDLEQAADLNEISQFLKFGDSINRYDWNIVPLTDSTSKIIVNVKDLDHSFANKLQVPFSDTEFEKRTRKTLLEFNTVLQEHIKNFKVTIVGEDELPSTFCAYIPVTGTQMEKASGMMRNYPFLSSVLVENQVELNGLPFVEVVDWNRKTDSLKYNFCYPIIRSEKLPEYPEIEYKRFFGKKVLKAVYNGNYITSDRAWYALLDYAKTHNIAVEPKPIEFFFNNPNMGGNEIEWRAEIYLPIKEGDE
ncbi:GyrI-like domain-containing protein [Flagellimonas sp. DF-77]|uniref:GyrI-like domain-containing protein n=1 Tax=Flagellimonas algarum TaxID=3230298 RepID=UPI0033995159